MEEEVWETMPWARIMGDRYGLMPVFAKLVRMLTNEF